MIDMVFGGAGPQRFPAYVGVLKAFRDRGHIPNKLDYEHPLERMPRMCGTSAGALILGLYASGISINRLEKVVFDADPTKFADKNAMKFVSCGIRHGLGRIIHYLTGKSYEWAGPYLNSNDKLHAFLLELTQGKTFRECPGLFTIATNMTDSREFMFNALNTPDAKVATGIMASIAIPLIFEGVRYNHNGRELLLMDGGIRHNFPVDYFMQYDGVPIVGVSVKSMEKRLPMNHTFSELLTFLIGNVISSKEDENVHDAQNVKLITIEHEGDDNVLESMDFRSCEEKKKKWVDIGYEASYSMIDEAKRAS